MNIWLVSPAWGRYAVTRLALAQRRWLCDTLTSRGQTANSVIVADDDNLDIAREYGFETVEKDNTDVGAKFNAGYKYAADQGADVFVHVGSDDWLHPNAFNVLETLNLDAHEPEIESGGAAVWTPGQPQIVAQRHLTLVDLTRGVARRCQVQGRYGCIPWLIPRSALKPYRYMPIAPGYMRGIDGALIRGMKRSPNWHFQDADPLWCVDFKSDTNITAYRAIADSLGMTTTDEDPWALLRTMYPRRLVYMAQRTVIE